MNRTTVHELAGMLVCAFVLGVFVGVAVTFYVVDAVTSRTDKHTTLATKSPQNAPQSAPQSVLQPILITVYPRKSEDVTKYTRELLSHRESILPGFKKQIGGSK